MSQQISGGSGFRAFIPVTDMSAFRLVKLTSDGKIVYATAGDTNAVGFTQDNASAEYPVTVKLVSPSSTFKACISGTATVGASLFTSVSGTLSGFNTGSGVAFTSLEGTVDGPDAILEVIKNW